MVYNVWSELQQTMVDQSPQTSNGTVDLSVLSIPILVTLFLALLLAAIAIFGQTLNPTMGASEMEFFKSGNKRAYSLILAATVFAFLGFLMSPINLFSSGLNNMLSLGQSTKMVSMWLDFAGVLLCFVAAVILAVVVTPYDYSTGYRQRLAKYGGFGVLLLSFLALLTSFILQKVDTQKDLERSSEEPGQIAKPDIQPSLTKPSNTQSFSSSAVFPADVDSQMQSLPIEQFRAMLSAIMPTQAANEAAVSMLITHVNKWPASAVDKNAKLDFIKMYFKSPQK